MRKLNVNMKPTGGYFFIESDGTRLRGTNWKTLTLEVAKYRKRNGLPPGMPAREVREQACKRTPGCQDPEPKLTAPAPPVSNRPQPETPAAMKGRVLQWLTSLRAERLRTGSLFRLVDPATAKARAATCRTCPRNKEIGSGCGSCQATMKEFRREIVPDPKRDFDSSLGGCGVLGCDLRTAVHLDEIRMDNAALPPHCFRKTLPL